MLRKWKKVLTEMKEGVVRRSETSILLKIEEAVRVRAGQRN